jgi:hypothetical protein
MRARDFERVARLIKIETGPAVAETMLENDVARDLSCLLQSNQAQVETGIRPAARAPRSWRSS